MVNSTDLPPPVMMDSTDVRVDDPHVVLQLRHMLFRRRFLGEGPRQHKFSLENGPRSFDPAIQGCRHPQVKICQREASLYY